MTEEDLGTPGQAAQLSKVLVEGDFAEPLAEALTSAIISLVKASVTSVSPRVVLLAALHGLIYPLVEQEKTPLVADIIAYFSQRLFPSLSVDIKADEQCLQIVKDALLDVIWQIDQLIENGAVKYEHKGPATDFRSIEANKKTMNAVTQGEKRDDKTHRDNLVATEAKRKSRLAELVKGLVDLDLISTQECLERLEVKLLATSPLSLIRDATNFNRLEVRSRTALYYKQQKFNLLREESEGYAKLVAELLANMGPPHSVVDGRSQENHAHRLSRAQKVNDSIKSLIGNFDLDPDRALDIVLDTFSDQIIQHHQFFVDFLSVSPWAPKNRNNHMKTESAQKGKSKECTIEIGLESDTGSHLISQILGFKFIYYQSPGVGEIPEKMYLMSALLIWNGFIKLADLWPHLSPDDASITKLDATFRDEQAKLARSVGGANALMMAGALADDDGPKSTADSSLKESTTTAATSSSDTVEVPNQKLGLLRALLSIGDLEHSFFILALFPFLVQIFPDLADLLLRLLEVAITPAYDRISVASSTNQYSADYTAARNKYVPNSGLNATSKAPAATSVLRYLSGQALPEHSPNKEFTFFFPEWRDRLTLCENWEQALGFLELIMPPIGVLITRNFVVYTKICRIVASDLRESGTEGPRASRWSDLLRQFLLPGMSLLEHHASAALQLWTVLELLSPEERYRMYGEWKDTMYRRIPALSVRKAEAERDVKSILRRLSTENVKKLGKTLAKCAHTNPTIIFQIALNQVQSYDNLIMPVVEAARYLTEFGYDVLAYSLLDALSSDRSKTKEDGTSVSLWLQSLATFAGQLYRRWPPMGASLVNMLQYLLNQLVCGNSKDLVILREIIARMTGIEPFADLSDAQVMSLAGGKYLRSEVFHQTEISQASRRNQMIALQGARSRLTNALKKSGLIMPLLVNIAIQRQACVFDTSSHLKSLGTFFDQCHAVLFQYSELLYAIIEPEELVKDVPSIFDLMERFQLEPAIAFDIARPRLRLNMRNHDATEAKAQDAKRKAGLAKLAREKAASQDKTKISPGDEIVADIDTNLKEANVVGNTPDPSGDLIMDEVASPHPLIPSTTSYWHPGLLDVIQTVDGILSDEVKLTLGSPFYVTFWQLNLYDVHYPKERYDAEISRLTTMQRVATESSSLKADDKERFTKIVVDLATKLMEEASRHSSARSATSRRLGREKVQWFSSVKTDSQRDDLLDQILQYCVHPRAKLSLPDAAYAYQFVKRMHSVNTPGFYTINFYNKLLTQQLGPVIYTCTENEARNYARFLYDVLDDLFKWHGSSDLYSKEAIGPQLHGFLQHWPKSVSTVHSIDDYVTHKAFREKIGVWHRRMAEGFVLNFESEGYMHIKNSILVLTKIAPCFPIEYETGIKLEEAVSSLIDAEKRDDLKILAQGYKAVLSKRKKHWLGAPKNEPRPQSVPASRATSPRASVSTTKTSASAAPTRPQTPIEPTKEAPPASRSSAIQPPQPTRSLQAQEASRTDKATSLPPSTVPSGPRSGLPPRPSASSTRNSINRVAESDLKPLPISKNSKDSRDSLEVRDGQDSRNGRDTRDARDQKIARDARDTRDARDARDVKVVNHVKDMKDLKDVKDIRDVGDVRTDKEIVESKDMRDARDVRDVKDSKGVRDSRDPKDAKDARDTRYPRDARDVRDAREPRDARDARNIRDSRNPRDVTKDNNRFAPTVPPAKSQSEPKKNDSEKTPSATNNDNTASAPRNMPYPSTLPARPSGINGLPAKPLNTAKDDAAERMRQEVLASRNSTSARDKETVSNDSGPVASTNSRDAPISRGPSPRGSRAPSPRSSEKRDRDNRDVDVRSERRRLRSRSIESSHSSSRYKAEKVRESDTKDRPREERRKDDLREDSRRHSRDAPRTEPDDRRRDVRDSRDPKPSVRDPKSRRDADRERDEVLRKGDRYPPDDSRRREGDNSRAASASSKDPERVKNESTVEAKADSKVDARSSSRAGSVRNRPESSQHHPHDRSAARITSDTFPLPVPTVPLLDRQSSRDDRNPPSPRADRLRPPPTARVPPQPPVVAEPVKTVVAESKDESASEAFSIKGRGGGASRLLNSALGSSRGPSGNDTPPRATRENKDVRGTKDREREDSYRRDQRQPEDEGRKRSLADRLADDRDTPSKRTRTSAEDVPTNRSGRNTPPTGPRHNQSGSYDSRNGDRGARGGNRR